MTKVKKTEEQWRAELSTEQYHVLRQKGTEAPFLGEYDHTFEPGTYRCAGCGTELYRGIAQTAEGAQRRAGAAVRTGHARSRTRTE